MPDLTTTKSAIRKLLGIVGQATGLFEIETTLTTVADQTERTKLRIHNVNDASNQEYMELGSVGTFGFRIMADKTGTGTLRNLTLRAGGANICTVGANLAMDFNGAAAGVYFRNGFIIIYNPAVTFAYILNTAAITANRTITFPLLTGNDIMVTEAMAQTLTNKTISADSNTITNIENADIKAGAAISLSKIEARESLVAQWDVSKTWTNIGTSFVDVYDNTLFVNADAKAVRIDFTGKTQYRMVAQWNKIGSGTQQLKACTTAAPTTDILHTFTNIVSGENDSGLVTLPAFATGQHEIKLMALSSTSADDPVFQGVRIWLK